MAKSTFDLKVTLAHVALFLASVLAIGAIIFYLGYRAGKTAASPGGPPLEEENRPAEVIGMGSETPEAAKPRPRPAPADSAIAKELDLHRDQGQPASTNIISEPYLTIQVGAFADFANAKSYSEKFSRIGYATEIIATVMKDRKLYRVRVGQFRNREEAQREMEKLERLENKKFAIVSSR
jgi:cell division protein FtsN